MTMNVTTRTGTRAITDVALVEQAFREAGLDPADLDARFIQYWVNQGKTIDDILVIAGEQPRRRVGAAA